MMRCWTTGFMVAAAFAGGSAHAATARQSGMSSVKFDLKRGDAKSIPTKARRFALREIFEGDSWEPMLPVLPRHDTLPVTVTDATSRAVAVTGYNMARIDLHLQALAGYRSFDTVTSRRATLGWTVANNGNELGVGTTGTYGIRLARAWRFTPFVSLDYNRVDSARYVDATSPRPYVPNNADTGLTGTVGATVSHRFGAERRFRVLAFGALVAATNSGEPPREFASVGARFVHALGDSGIEAVWEQVGFSVDYRLTDHARISGAIVQTINRANYDTMAAKFGLLVAL